MTRTDVLIIGAGAAGLFCAGVCQQLGLKVVLLVRSGMLCMVQAEEAEEAATQKVGGTEGSLAAEEEIMETMEVRWGMAGTA